MFDGKLHKEYVCLSCLRHLLKVEKIVIEGIDDNAVMRFCKLKKEFERCLALEEDGGMLKPSKGGAAATLDKKTRRQEDKKKDSLQALIDRLNEALVSDFTGGDRVVIANFCRRISKILEVGETIRRDDRQVFEKSLLPKAFDETARKAYVENT